MDSGGIRPTPANRRVHAADLGKDGSVSDLSGCEAEAEWLCVGMDARMPNCSHPLFAMRQTRSKHSIRSARLADDEVHVWTAELEWAPAELDALSEALSPDEHARARRFRFERDRHHYIAGRGILRHILAAYLDQQPSELQFTYSPSGKPSLAASPDPNGLCFNLSHSHALAVYALTRNREIGVDVERLRTDFPCEQIAERFFSPQEVSKLRGLPDPMKYKAFFNCWTRKEAYIKATGEGLSIGLDRFEVSLAPEEQAALLNAVDDPSEAARWTIEKLSPGHGYVGAVAVKGRGLEFKYYRWPLDLGQSDLAPPSDRNG
jgi:4'-phosphopantetheinyl transferase